MEADAASLNWRGWVEKKAFRTLAKQSWKRRWLELDAASFTLSWFDAPPSAAASISAGAGSAAPPRAPLRVAKGVFALDALKLVAAASAENKRANEFKVQSNSMLLYACTETPEERSALLQRLNAARRRRICGDDGAALILSDAAGSLLGYGGGAKLFSWGIGAMLGNGRHDTQAWGQPQLVAALSAEARELAAGPEHCGAVDRERVVHLWGGNDFRQVGASGAPPAVFTPLRMARLLPRKVLSLACGGSHTLAIVSESGDASAGGVTVAWGTGTLGQLGLGPTRGRAGEGRLATEPLIVPLLDAATGARLLARRVAAGLVTSGAITVAGDAYVWGDASLGRLGLDGVPEAVLDGGGGGGAAAGPPPLVNAHIEWSPRRVTFDCTVLCPALARAPRIAVLDLAMGGAFSLFLLAPAPPAVAGGGGGGVLAVSGALGVDITRDKYGLADEAPLAALDELVNRETRAAAASRAMRPSIVAPFRGEACVYAIAAGARHAAAVAAMDDARAAPRVYTAGKGWLGQGAGEAALLLPRPVATSFFAPVRGELAETDGERAGAGRGAAHATSAAHARAAVLNSDRKSVV